ncbi:MAG: SpoIIE family protein phosphatase [Candidatus Cloacimonetes bacterium]|nr:SpoIIE family protein phosphatase [Candidatus Cloacimonadota bacterium]
MFGLALALLILLAVSVYNLDQQALVDEAYYMNHQALKKLESELEGTLAQARTMLAEAVKVSSEEELLRFESDPDGFNRELNRQFLVGKDWDDYLSGATMPALGVVPYRWKDIFFTKLSNWIQLIFDDSYPLEPLIFHPDLVEPLKAIRSLNIRPQIDLERQKMTISVEEAERFDLLDNKRDGMFSHPALYQHMNPRVFDFSDGESERLVALEGGESHPLSGFERPAVWMACYIYRAQTRFGSSWHPHAELAIHAFRPNPMESRGVFFRGSSAGARYAYIWNWLPTDYPNDNDRVHIFPYRVMIGMMAEATIALSGLRQKLNREGLSNHLLTAEFEDQSLLSHDGNRPRNEKLVLEGGQLQGMIFSSESQKWYSSRLKSYLLPGVTLYVGTPADLVESKHYQRWVLVVLLFPMTLLGYILGIRVGRQPLTEGFTRSLKDMLGFSGGRKNQGCSELNRLSQAMQEFSDATIQKQSELQLHSRLRSILNEPNRGLDWYMEEFFYVAHGMRESLGFTVQEMSLAPQGHVVLKFPRLKEEDRALAEIITNLATEASRVAWLAKKASEETTLQAELDLGKNLQRQLLGVRQSHSLGEVSLNIFSRESTGQPSGDFSGCFVSEDSIYVYVASVVGRGLGSSLVAAYLKNYLDALLQQEQTPSQILQRLMAFLIKHEDLADAYLSLVVLRIQRDGEIVYAGSGHFPILVLGERKLIRALVPPMGIYQGPWQDQRLVLQDRETIGIGTGGLWDHFRTTRQLKWSQVLLEILDVDLNHLLADSESDSGYICIWVERGEP